MSGIISTAGRNKHKHLKSLIESYIEVLFDENKMFGKKNWQKYSFK